MQAVWLEDRKLRLRDDIDVPEPAAGEARIRVRRAGICNTDLELVRGYYPYTGILGHEFCGVVDAGPPAWLGKRVVGDINASCGNCDTCRAGRRTHCPHRTVLGIVGRDGAFADYLCLPVENLHAVPDGLDDDRATFTEPLAAALEIQEQIDVTATDRVVVIGDGKLGLLVAQSLALRPCHVQVVGRHAEKWRVLQARGIAAGGVETLPDHTADIAVECTGNPDGFAMALQALRPRGTLVLKSTYAGALQLDAAQVVVQEITVVGSRCGPFAPALQLLAAGDIDVSSLVAARMPLRQALHAFERARQPGTLKVLLEIS